MTTSSIAMSSKHLRLATYGCPSQPIEYYHLIKSYMEETTRLKIELIYDTDRLGPSTERGDNNTVDVAFVSTNYGLELSSGRNKARYTVLPIGAVTEHPSKPLVTAVASWSAVVVRADKRANLNSFLDLRGLKLAYSEPTSFSGVTVLLNKLKQAGENAAFFSNMQKCGSHLSCLHHLVEGEQDVTVVDSVALCNYKRLHPRLADRLHTAFVWGPHVHHPIIVNNDLPGSTRDLVVSALASLTQHSASPAVEALQQYGVQGFAEPQEALRQAALDMLNSCDKLSIDVAYY